MTLMMTSAQLVETLVNVTNNSPSRDYSHPDDQTTQTTETPGFKPFTVSFTFVTRHLLFLGIPRFLGIHFARAQHVLSS